MKSKRKIDKIFLFLILSILFWGFIIFVSASLGLLTREGASFSSVLYKHIVSILLGLLLLLICIKTPYIFWRKYSLYIFLASIFLTLLVFVPGLGMEHGGATRWIDLKIISIQPAEFLKIGFVIYLSAWLSGVRRKIQDFHYSILPFVILMSVVGAVLLLQPDMGTFFVIGVSGISVLIVAGVKWRWISALFGAALLGVLNLYMFFPYIKARIDTFLDPAKDVIGAGYQIKQSLIAIGSGGLFGRGVGQSIQKFSFLPEPISDSIFAVAAEEFGFLGGFVLISLFILIAIRGLKIASSIENYFGSLLVVGIVVLIVGQSLINIASMLGVFPLTGMPLLFVSHGGSAFLASLAGIGIILNVSKEAKL